MKQQIGQSSRDLDCGTLRRVNGGYGKRRRILGLRLGRRRTTVRTAGKPTLRGLINQPSKRAFGYWQGEVESSVQHPWRSINREITNLQ